MVGSDPVCPSTDIVAAVLASGVTGMLPRAYAGSLFHSWSLSCERFAILCEMNVIHDPVSKIPSVVMSLTCTGTTG